MKNFLKWFGIGLMILVIAAFVLMSINTFLPAGWKLSAEAFVVLSAVILSVAWTFTPGLRIKFGELASNIKVIINLALMILLAGLMFLFTCTGWNPIPGVACTVEGAKALGVLVFIAIVGNQVTYVASPQPLDVRAAKSERPVG
ncbi:MAG: hypothetical protein C0401_06585 [Anaerolinea sp.]|nr:hypothetical protein [Anaerolinea sp.]